MEIGVLRVGKKSEDQFVISLDVEIVANYIVLIIKITIEIFVTHHLLVEMR